MRKRNHYTLGVKLTDVEKDFLNGAVKEVMLTTYKAHLKANEVIQGKIEADSSFSEDNYIVSYHRNGLLAVEHLFGANDAEIKFYNEQGIQIESHKYYGGKLNSKSFYTYNDKGQFIELRSTDAEGNLTSRTVNTLNDIGQTTESLSYYGIEQKLSRRTVYEFEENIREINGIKHRNILSAIHYKGDGSIEYSSRSKYNEQGNRIESIMEYTDEKKKKYNTRSTQKYNDHGDCIEHITYKPDGSIDKVYTSDYEYDSNGKKIEPKREPYNPLALEPGEREEIENDHHNNWLKKIKYFENRVVNMQLRQIKYYDEPSENEPPFIHPLTLQEPQNIESESHKLEPLEPEQAKWLAEGMPTPDAFPIHRYYAMRFNEIATTTIFQNAYTEVFALLKLLEKNFDAYIIHSVGTVRGEWQERVTRFTIGFRSYPGYLLQASNILRYSEDEFVVPDHISNLIEHSEEVCFSPLLLLRPSDNSKSRETYFEEMLTEHIEDLSLTKKPEKPYIHIIETTGNNFVMKEHPVDDTFEIRDLNVNYGYGFQQFHDDLLERFNKSTKGLVLFHGEPGTGKTYYIRHLLRTMVSNNKVVIYMPPNMVDHLVEPGFMTFLAHSVRDWSAEGYFCVLLIEDAEPLLAKRQEGVRIQGVTNLLNLSDGLLNDMLNLQIICTFNVDLKKLDSALLRPGRLIARKEFKALSELDANLLAQRLGIKHQFKGPATLSEIYAMRKNHNTLIHDVEQDRDASTFIDDL